VEDAETCLLLVSTYLKANTAGGPSAGEVCPPRLPSSKDQVSAMWNEKLDFPSTVGELHEVVENLAPGAWSAFIELWHEACGIEEPPRDRPIARRFRPGAPILGASPGLPSPLADLTDQTTARAVRVALVGGI
jgi:hypothetical protein